MTEYSRVANGSFVSTGGAQVINLPFQPKRVKIRNVTAWKNANTACIVDANWSSLQNLAGVNYTLVMGLNSSTALLSDWVSTNGISTFAAGQLLQFGPVKQIVASTGGATTSFQVTAHGYAAGDVVLFEGLYQSATTGMPQIASIPFTVASVTDANNFVVNWDTSNATYYTNLSASPASAKVKKVLYPYLYFPGTSFINGITLGTTTTVTTTSAHNLRVGQEVAFRIPSQWGTVELNSLPNTLTPGAPAYGYVVSVTDFKTVVVNIDSSNYTAFTVLQTVASLPFSYPQIVAVGDVNTGGEGISSTSVLYPPPVYEPIGTTQFGTINGPAIRGSFVNNTSQGFIIGAGTANTLSTAKLCGAVSDVIVWEAYYDDINGP